MRTFESMITTDEIAAIVKEAAKLMSHEGFNVMHKGTVANLVTSSDIAVQHFLTERLAALLPGSGFLCEEEDVEELSHEYVWIIDPIDGTANYARGLSDCAISVGLEHNGEIIAGVVYSPDRGELYTAEKGRGAFCNGKPIHVTRRPFEEGIICTAMSTYRKEFAKACSDIIFDVFMECNDFRRFGAASVELCLIASGYADLYFEMRLQPWDYAASSLILQEAGGTICDFDGAFPSLRKASLVLAATSENGLSRLLDAVHRHLPALPY